MTNSYEYFTEIEERFQRRRGTLTMLSPLDWALMETWREAGVPLEAVLRGVDDAFDKYDARLARSTRRPGKVNGLAWAAQSVMAATEALKDAAIGLAPAKPDQESGFEAALVREYLLRNANALHRSRVPEPADTVVRQTSEKLHALAHETVLTSTEELERMLVVLEERLYAVLTLVTSEQQMSEWREQAGRGLVGNRGMSAVQVRQVTQQFLNRRILEAHGLPRLSLFYMEHH